LGRGRKKKRKGINFFLPIAAKSEEKQIRGCRSGVLGLSPQ